MKRKIMAADLFCGGGGTGTGMIQAFQKAGVNHSIVGVNHWNLAIQTNEANHGDSGKYYCAGVDAIDPCDAVPGGHLDFLWASPECTNHSKAKGGKPRSNQSRCQPEMLLSWVRKLVVKRLYVENVAEFQQWGPLLAVDTMIDGKKHLAGMPDPRKKGVLFRDWIESLKRSGYKVDWQIMNAADYGAPTCRERLIIQAVRIGTGEKIIWPTPTHSKEPGIFGEKPWVPARDIIDWSIKGKSIFDRKKPLAPNTIHRIEAGIRKYWGEWAEPFLIILRGTAEGQDNASVRTLDEPVPTVSAGGIHAGLVQPFMTVLRGTSESHLNNSTAMSLQETVPALTTGLNVGVVEPFITRYNGGDDRNHAINDPVPVMDCSNRYGVVEGKVEAFVMATGHTSGGGRSTSIDEPISTVVTKAEHCLVQPMFIPQHSAGTVKPVNNPMPTIAGTGSIAMVEGVVKPFVSAFYGSEKDKSRDIDDTIGTICCKDRFALTEGRIFTTSDGKVWKLDILFRMFQPHELAAATGFPKDYRFIGNKSDAVKMIGNAVPPALAKALVEAAIQEKKTA